MVHLPQSLVELVGDHRADVRAMGVQERDEDELAALCRETNQAAMLVTQGEVGRGGWAAELVTCKA